jgi:hypothetical protein
VYHATSRVSVLKFAAAASISIAAIATALPGVIGNISDLATASVRPATEGAEPGERRAVEIEKPAVGAKKPAPSTAADLSVLTAPYDSTLATRGFSARSTREIALDIAYSTFALPPHRAPARTALARMPQPKPGVFSSSPDGALEANADVLAYAPSSPEFNAPFEAVMARPAIAAIQDEDAEDGLRRPRPRPDPTAVLGWLDGRALGQFAPGQHAWVQNPLPQSVFDEKQQRCLALGVYFEARGESTDGQAAVAQVILNRVRNPTYPKTICGVVFQNEKVRNGCQFSFACDGRSDRVTEVAAWKTAQEIALDVTEGKIWIEEVGDSTHYHAGYVRPGWGGRMIQKDRLGQHIFYRTRKGGWS